jgi:hypothetical protein
VTNTHEDDNKDSKKKKKKHRGYAFVVYEREKDMKGKHHSSPLDFKAPDSDASLSLWWPYFKSLV